MSRSAKKGRRLLLVKPREKFVSIRTNGILKIRCQGKVGLGAYAKCRDETKKLDKERLEVTFSIGENQLVFSHNVSPFSLDDIYALINGRSSKPLETPGIIGQFGRAL